MIWKSLFDGSGLEWFSVENEKQIPSVPGAYVLVVDVAKVFEFSSPVTGTIEIDSGIYFYAGSARGKGGLRSRLMRHFKQDKKPHWHIDQLTTNGSARGAYISEGLSECDLVEMMLKTGRFGIVHEGIGSTDCNRCDSHLLSG